MFPYGDILVDPFFLTLDKKYKGCLAAEKSVAVVLFFLLVH